MSVTPPTVAPLTVAIAEDSVLLREGVTRILGDAGLDVVAAYDNADALLMRVRSLPPDIVIVDIRLPPTHSDEGMRAALEIRQRYPGVAVLVLSQYVELGLAMQLLSESAEKVGYLLKDRISDVSDFVDAVRRVANGGSAIDPKIVSTLLAAAAERRSARSAHSAGAGGARADGLRHVESGNRRRVGDHAAGGREVRLQRVRQARPSVHP